MSQSGILSTIAKLLLTAILCASAVRSSRSSYADDPNPPFVHLRRDERPSYESGSNNNDVNFFYDRATKRQHNRFDEPENYVNLNLWDLKKQSDSASPIHAFLSRDHTKGEFENLKPKSDIEAVDDVRLPFLSKGAKSVDRPMVKREGHSLSIVNPLDVLRQRLMLEMARRRMKENQEQIRANDVILKTLGKRSSDPPFRSLASRSEEVDDEPDDEETRLSDKRRSHKRGYLDRPQEPSSDNLMVE